MHDFQMNTVAHQASSASTLRCACEPGRALARAHCKVASNGHGHYLPLQVKESQQAAAVATSFNHQGAAYQQRSIPWQTNAKRHANIETVPMQPDVPACLQVASQLVHKAELACNQLALQLRTAPAPAGRRLQVSQGLHSITQQALLRSHGSILAASVSIQSATTSSRSGSYTSMTSMSASLSASTASLSRSGSVSKPDSLGGSSARAPDGADQAGTRSPAASRRSRSAREVCSAHVVVTRTERVSGTHRQRQRLREGRLISRQELASQNRSHSSSNPLLQQLTDGVQHVEAHRHRSPSADAYMQHPELYTGNTEQGLKSAAADLEGTAGGDEPGQGPWQRAKRAHSRSPGSPSGHRSTKHRSRTGQHDQTPLPAGVCWCGETALGIPCLFPPMLSQPLEEAQQVFQYRALCMSS